MLPLGNPACDDETKAEAKLRGHASILFKKARTVDDIETLASGNPKRIERRAKNKLVGRALGQCGFWRWLWR